MSSLQRLPRTQLLFVVAVIIVIAELFANLLDVGENDADEGSVGAWLGLSAFGIAVTALLLLYVVPRLRRGSPAVVFGVLAIITLAIFWSALPFAFGAAAIAASAPGDEQPTTAAGGGLKAGAALGVLAIIAGFVFCIIG
jgi:hypothetical protein